MVTVVIWECLQLDVRIYQTKNLYAQYRIPETSYHYDIVPGDFVPLGWRDRTTYRSYSQICFNELRMIIISISKHAPKRSFAVDSL